MLMFIKRPLKSEYVTSFCSLGVTLELQSYSDANEEKKGSKGDGNRQ